MKCSTNKTCDISLIINGRNFVLDTADDSIYSDGNVYITVGTFIISSGDDAVHADPWNTFWLKYFQITIFIQSINILSINILTTKKKNIK